MSVKKNVLAGWAAHLVTVLIGFFLMPYILGILGESRYGAWLLVNAVAGYSGIIYAGMGATICRYVADSSARREWERLNQIVSSVQGVYYGTASIVILGTVGFMVIAPSLNNWGNVPIHEIQISIGLVGLSIALGMIASVYGGVLVGTQQLHIKRGIEVICGIVRGGLTLLMITEQWGLVTLSSVFLAVTLLEHGLSALFAYRQVPTLSVSPRNIRRSVLKECFSFSAFNAVALAAEYLIYFTDTIVIGVMISPEAIVPYQIALRIAQMIQMPIAQIGEAILPKAGELHANADREQLGILVAKSMGVAFLLAGGFFIGGLFFGDQLVTTWIGKTYPDTATVMAILLATQVVAMPMIIVRKALLGSGEVRVPAFIDLLEAFINLVLSLLLVRSLGIVGVAIGTLIPLVLVELCLLLPFSMRRLHISGSTLLSQVVGPAIPSLLLLTIFSQLVFNLDLPANWPNLLMTTAGGGAILLVTRGAVQWLTRTGHTDLTASTTVPEV